jgi:hypothetical protein
MTADLDSAAIAIPCPSRSDAGLGASAPASLSRAAAFECHKSSIYDLYMTRNLALAVVKDIMEDEYGFRER